MYRTLLTSDLQYRTQRQKISAIQMALSYLVLMT